MNEKKGNTKKRNIKKNEKYTCKTCGKGATSTGHLCSPIPQEKAVVCSTCGKIDCNAKHVCHPEVIKFKCDSCGRAAVSKDMLCSPVKMPRSNAKKVKSAE